ncbi:transposase [Streptomyces sp. NBC_01597]|uniref:transposase n=1 Tax=Streptomyces sp. NBC_01597 TaxID=2975891 RepID=UPI003866D6F6
MPTKNPPPGPPPPNRSTQSTNRLERVNREIKRRIDVVQVFPNNDTLIRLVDVALRNARRLDRLPPPLPTQSQHGTSTAKVPRPYPTLRTRPPVDPLHHGKGHDHRAGASLPGRGTPVPPAAQHPQRT